MPIATEKLTNRFFVMITTDKMPSQRQKQSNKTTKISTTKQQNFKICLEILVSKPFSVAIPPSATNFNQSKLNNRFNESYFLNAKSLKRTY